MHDPYGERPAEFIKQVGYALLRIAALIVLIVAHWGLQFTFTRLNSITYQPAYVLLDAISYVVFAFIYVYLLWDVVKIFVPWLRPKLNPIGREAR